MMMRLTLIMHVSLIFALVRFTAWTLAKRALVPFSLRRSLHPTHRCIGVSADRARRVVVLPHPSLRACHMLVETRAVAQVHLPWAHWRRRCHSKTHQGGKRMPRSQTGPTVPWPSLEQCTPLGTLLVEWMWAQKPPMPVSLLASRIGVDRSTLFGWLTTDRKPQPMQLLVLSQVTGLPALGLARHAVIPEERVLRQREALWGYVEWEMRRMHVSMPNDEFDAFLEHVRAEREVALSDLRMEGEPS
jgi:hypothetical protein